MPTKESTIRLKLVGSSDVTSALQAFNRQARANMYALNRAMKVEDEAKRGNQSDPTIQAATRDAASKRFAAEKRIDETLQVARDSRDKSKWENQRIAERESLKFQLAGMDKIAESEPKLALQVAKMKMAAAELATDKVAQINKKEQEATAASSVAIQRRADAEKAVVTKANAAEFRRGEAEQSAYWLADMKRKQQAAGTGGEKGEMKGALSGFGGKMILGGAVGTTVGTATGQAQLGSMIGNITSAALFGGPTMAGLVAGMEVAGAAIEGVRESMKAATQATEAWSGNLLSLTDIWANLGAQINRNPFGKAMEGEVKRSSAALEKAVQQYYEIDRQDLSVGDMAVLALGGKTSKQTRMDESERELQSQLESRKAAQQFRDEEYKKQIANAKNLQTLQDRVVSASGMHNSLLKDRTKLEAQITYSNQERADRFRSEISNDKASVVEAQRVHDELLKEYNAYVDKGANYGVLHPDYQSAHLKTGADLELANLALDEAKATQANRPQQQANEEAAAQSEIRDKQLGMEESYYQARKALTDESWDSYFKTTQVGYAREEAMFKAHWSRRERDIQASQDPGVRAAFKIDKTQAFAAWEAERARKVESTASSADISALRAVQQRQVGDWKEQGLSDSQIDLRKDKEIRGEKVQLDIRSASAMRDYADAAQKAREEVEYQVSFKIFDTSQLEVYMQKYDKLVKAEHDDSMRTEALSLRERMARATRDYAGALDAAAEAERRRFEATQGVKTPEEITKHMEDWKKTNQEEFDLPLKLSREQTERQLEVLRGSMTRLDALKEQIKVQNPHAKPEEIAKLANTQETYRLGEQYGSPINRFQLQKKDILKAVEGGIITKERAELELRQAYTSMMGPSVGGQSTDIASYRGQLQSAITNAYNNPQLTRDEQRTMYQELIDLLKQGIPMRV
jgi:hypothetical protein